MIRRPESFPKSYELAAMRSVSRVTNLPSRVTISHVLLLLLAQESEPRMTARTLDGYKIRDQIFAELKDEVRLLAALSSLSLA